MLNTPARLVWRADRLYNALAYRLTVPRGKFYGVTRKPKTGFLKVSSGNQLHTLDCQSVGTGGLTFAAWKIGSQQIGSRFPMLKAWGDQSLAGAVAVHGLGVPCR